MCNVFFIYGIYNRIRKHWSDYIKTIILLKAKGRSLNNIHLTFSKYLSIFIHYYVISSYLLRQWNALNMWWLCTVEKGKNRDRSDMCELWFLFQFLGMIFSALNFKANKNFFWSSRTLKWFLFCCFLLSCTSYVMGRMLR